MEERLIDLETRLAFQERTLLELEEVILRQQQDLDQLTRRLHAAEQRVEAVAEARQHDAADEPPPPHY